MRRNVDWVTRNIVLARYCIHRLVCWDVDRATKIVLLWAHLVTKSW